MANNSSSGISDKKPQTIQDLMQAIKSLLACFLRKWAENEDHIAEVVCDLASDKAAFIKSNAASYKDTATALLTAQKEEAGFILWREGELEKMKVLSATYMEDIEFLKELQATVAELLVAAEKVLAGCEIMMELTEHEELRRQVEEAYSSFVATAPERYELMDAEDNEFFDAEDESCDQRGGESEPDLRDLDQAMEDLRC